MCGIVGYVGQRSAVEYLLKGLSRLEYRGYDSAGVAFFQDGKVQIKKSEGKLENVKKLFQNESALKNQGGKIQCGIGHTRWATHGKPTTQNAHPHQTDHVVLVHNGIIENFLEIKSDVLKKGYQPQSETDSELCGFLILDEMKKGLPLREAVSHAFQKLLGSNSVVVASEKEPGVIIGARNGSPLVVAKDPQGGGIIASDAQALIEINREVYFLESGDLVEMTEKSLDFYSLETGNKIKRVAVKLDLTLEQLDKGGFPHFMLKEIFEQPTALTNTFNALIDRTKSENFTLAKPDVVKLLSEASQLVIVACGTSSHAGMLAKYWFEANSALPVSLEYASEIRYRKVAFSPKALVIAISQSGETADTLAVVRDFKKQGIATLGITNVRGSTLSRETNAILFTAAGPEVGVAATKTFLTQLLTLFCMVNPIGFKESILKLPHSLGEFISPNAPVVSQIKKVAKRFQDAKGFFFMGRGTSYPLALEGALKLKEIAYMHAEGYAAGELKHGPIAMIDSEFCVVAIIPKDQWREKTLSNLEEVKARGARVIGVCSETDRAVKELCQDVICLPAELDQDPILAPFFIAPVLQLLSYELAVLKGTDVDKPRNLAKSVTVE